MSEERIIADRTLLLRVMDRAFQKSRNGWEWSDSNVNCLSHIVDRIRYDVHGHRLSYAPGDEKKITYATREEHVWCDEKRTRSTLGRYLRRRLGVESERLSDERLQQLSEFVFSVRYPVEDMIKIVSGKELISAYKRNAGGSSCMTGHDSELMTMLAENPDKCSILIFGDDIARALLWTADCGQKVLDRIYPNYGGHIEALVQWAHSKGIYTRTTQCATFHAFTDGGQSERAARFISNIARDLRITVTRPSNDMYPFLDSFYNAREDGRDKLILSCMEGFGEYELQQTNGEITSGNCCSYCDSHDEDGYEVEGEWYCEDCFHNSYTICESCDEPTSNDYTCYVSDICETWCEGCVDHHTAICYRCDDRVTTDSMTVAEDTSNAFCEDCTGIHLESCERCGSYFEDDVANGLCTDCGTDCDECGERAKNDDLENGLCEDCGTDCEGCDKRINNDDLENDLCTDCGSDCEECGERVPNTEVNEDDLCKSCAKELAEVVES